MAHPKSYFLGFLNNKVQVVWVCTNHNADNDNPNGHWQLDYSNFDLTFAELEGVREKFFKHWNEVHHR